jgi:hypothetical protein
METSEAITTSRVPKWVLALLPIIALIGLVALFVALNPLAFFTGAFPPLEELAIQRVIFPESGRIQLSVINGGPDPVTVSQVLVDDAYWQFTIDPDNTLERLQQATVDLVYPWVDGEPLPITLITSTGATFGTEVDVAVESPQTSAATLASYLSCWVCSGTPSCACLTASG